MRRGWGEKHVLHEFYSGAYQGTEKRAVRGSRARQEKEGEGGWRGGGPVKGSGEGWECRVYKRSLICGVGWGIGGKEAMKWGEGGGGRCTKGV